MRINFNRDTILAKVRRNTITALKQVGDSIKSDIVQGLSVEHVSQPGDLFPGKDTGALQASVKIKDDTGEEKPKITVYTDSPYARGLEYGCRITTEHGEFYIYPRPGWRHTFAEWKPKIIKAIKSAVRKGFK